jgi:hypothetical protein
LIVAGGSACDGSTGPTRVSYALLFHQDSTDVSGDPAITDPSNCFYCHHMVPSAGGFSATVTAIGDAVSFRYDGASSDGSQDFVGAALHFDSLPLMFASGNVGSSCLAVTIRVKQIGDELRGSWDRGINCHGFHAVGTVTGTRLR